MGGSYFGLLFLAIRNAPLPLLLPAPWQTTRVKSHQAIAQMSESGIGPAPCKALSDWTLKGTKVCVSHGVNGRSVAVGTRNH